MENPLLSLERPIPFARVQAEHVQPAVRELLARAEARLQALGEGPATYKTTLGELEACCEPLELAMGVVEHLESVATTPAFRESYNAVLPDVSAFWSSIPLRDNVWRALLAFSRTDEAQQLDPTRRRYLDKTLAEFRRHGATLAEPEKQRLSAIDRELGLLTNKFSQNVLDSTNAYELLVEDRDRLRGMPESAIEAARASASSKGKSGYRLTLQAPSVIAVLTYADDPGLREQIWRAHNTRSVEGETDNRALIGRILELRRQKAQLLGFKDFADLVTEDRMAKTGARAREFVEELTVKTRAAFERENRELEEFRKRLEGAAAPAIRAWDVAYYSEKLRRERYDLDEEELREYFAADRVLSGAFQVAERLFGVQITPARGLSSWDPEVRCYLMRDASGAELGTFYVDPYPRENKRGGAWMHGLVTSIPPAPHVAVFCANVNPPVGGKPSLLNHRDVETFFHEFGHLLHHCLSRVNVRSLAGTRVAQDFVELPSQIMENWCSEREALNLFAAHYETGEPIPERLLERLRASQTFRAGNQQMRQLGFAAMDLALHTEYDASRDGDVMEYARGIIQRYSPAPLPEGYGMLAGFLHLFASPIGYAAGYYSYKWAEVLDADAFARFRSEGVLNERVGREFRDRILAQGDSADPMELFVSFMGREPRPEALLERQGLAA
ncbi:MAG TPA: M3 family metallopeptidase [Polyangiaceae bacterium]